MDMELFFKNLGIEPDDSQTPQISAQTLDKAQIIPYNGNELVNQETYSNDKDETNSNDDDSKDYFDVAFIVGEVGYDKSQLEGICSEIKAISEIIFERSNDVTISIYGLDGSGNTQSKWYGRADNIENVEVMLGKIEPKEIQNENGMVVVSECVDYVTLAHKNTESEERRNRAEYCFMFFDPLYQIEDGYNVFQYLAQSPRTDEYGMKLLEAISKDGTDIDFSTVTSCYSTIEEMTSSYAKQVSLKTNGINIEDISPESIVNESIEHIYGTAPDDDRLYEILIGTSYTVVNLKKPITEKYIENAIKYGHSYIDISEFDEEDIEDCADTDGDGLWDFQEIKVFKGLTETPENQIIWFEDGKLMLPTVNDMTKEVYKDIYSSEEIDAFREYFAEQYGRNVGSEFWNTPVLPINSHPTEPDGDGDGYNDIEDVSKLKNNIRNVNLKSNNGNFFKVTDIPKDMPNWESGFDGYGGNQGWLPNDDPYNDYGCGAIVVANMVEYLSSSNSDYHSYGDNYVTRNYEITYSKFLDLINNIKKYMAVDANGVQFILGSHIYMKKSSISTFYYISKG